MRGRKIVVLHICLLIAILSACAKPPQPAHEGQPAPEQLTPQNAPPQPQAEQQPEAKPPTASEARAKLAFVYEGVVKMDEKRRQSFITGDFNGDGSEDIAITVTPVKEKLEDINSEIANWLLCDAKAQPATDPHARLRRTAVARPVISPGDVALLAIIHGYGPEGWRDPEARQTYLIKSAVGDNMKMILKKDLLKMARSGKPVPELRGDMISQTLAGQSGFIYYTGARYAWYDGSKNKEVAAAPSAH